MDGFEFDPIDDTMLDRLVDGELTETRRRRLLEQLDRTPDGWRRCAMAFLEAQEWRTAFSSLAIAPSEPLSIAEPIAVLPAVVSAKRMSPGVRPFKRQLTNSLALSFCLMLGFWAGFGASGRTSNHQPPDAAESVVVAPALSPALQASHIEPRAPVENTERGRQGDAPVVLPDYVRGQLERRGFQVVEKPRLIPVEIRPGQTVFVPVAQMELRKDVVSRVF